MSVPKLSMPRLRNILCWTMIVVLPASLNASGVGGGMLYGKGTVWLNTEPLARPSAIFSGDVVVTQAGSVANIVASGSNVIIQPDSIIKFEDNALELEHGTVTVATSSGMKVHVGCVETTPVVNDWTEFEITDVNGTVHIFARKLDVNVSESIRAAGKLSTAGVAKSVESRRVTLPQGQTTDRDEHCRADSARSAGDNGFFTPRKQMLMGIAAIGGLGIWLGTLGDDPVSPWEPCQDTQTCQ